MTFDQFAMVYIALGISWAVRGTYRALRSFSGKGDEKGDDEKVRRIKKDAADLVTMGFPAWAPPLLMALAWAVLSTGCVFVWPLYVYRFFKKRLGKGVT